MSNTLKISLKKPVPVRAIFILNAIKILISFGIYTVFTTQGISIGGLAPSTILYTSLAYVATFAIMVLSILRRQVWGVRAMNVLDLLISLPASAFIGIGVAILSFGLTFHQKAKAYFGGE